MPILVVFLNATTKKTLRNELQIWINTFHACRNAIYAENYNFQTN